MKQLQQLLAFTQKLSRREKVVLYCATAFVVLALFDRALVAPVFGHIKSVETKIKERETEVNRAMRVVAQKERINREAAQYASYLEEAPNDDAGMVALLKEIESLANKSALYIVDMKPAGVKQDKGGVKKFYVNLSCEGQMERLMEFMYGVENSRSLLTIERYQISPKSRESSVAQCTISISRIVL